VDRKTMRRWGQALQSEDPEQLVRALAGRGGQRKLTTEIRAFVTVRFPEIYGQSRARYSQRLRAEIKAVFGVTLSGECLRPLLKSLRAELRQELNEPGVERKTQKRETACVGLPEPPSVTTIEAPTAPLPTAPPGLSPPAIRRESPVLPLPDPGQSVVGFCHHLGGLLFSAVLLDLEKQMATGGWLLKQWLATLLLGAVNIEQTKFLDFEDLHRLLGRTRRSLFPQRSELASVSTVPKASEL
jgi:hypothetical protein